MKKMLPLLVLLCFVRVAGFSGLRSAVGAAAVPASLSDSGKPGHPNTGIAAKRRGAV